MIELEVTLNNRSGGNIRGSFDRGKGKGASSRGWDENSAGH